MSEEPTEEPTAEAVCLTDYTADFADGTYRFWLTLRALNEFEQSGSLFAFHFELDQAIGIDAAGGFVYTGGAAPDARRVTNLIRLALIGGNSGTVTGETSEVSPTRAMQLVENYCYPARPIDEAAALAYNIGHAAIYGNRAARDAKAKAA